MTCNGRNVFTGEPVEVRFNGTITSVTSAPGAARWISPGWIDIQVNGFDGVDYNCPSISHEEIARSLAVQFSAGMTRCYPTVITGGPDDMVNCLRNLSRAKDTLKTGGAMEGFHVEGPHISSDDGPRGAHPRRWVRPPDLDEYRRWQEVDLTADGRVVLAGQDKLAGSALRLDDGVENLMKLANLTLAQAAQMASTNAAKAGKIAGRQAGLAPGDRSDFVIFHFDETAK